MSLGTLEIEILNVIWQIQKEDEDSNISVKDIVEYLNNKNINRAYTTVKTVMDRLSSKDLLVRYRSGKKFYYKSVMDKEEIAKIAINDMLHQFFDGNSIDLIRFVEEQFSSLVKD